MKRKEEKMKNKMSVEIKEEMINGKKHMRINVFGGTPLEKKEMLLKMSKLINPKWVNSLTTEELENKLEVINKD